MTRERAGDPDTVPIAGLAEVMTAYVVLREHPLKAGEQGPSITLDQGQLTEYQARQLMLHSSDDRVAGLLAGWDAGSEHAFVTTMQQDAVALQLRSTTRDPGGLTRKRNTPGMRNTVERPIKKASQ